MPHPTGAESSSEESVEDSNRYDDAEEDVEMVFHAQLQAQAQAQAAAIADQYGEGDDEDDYDDDDDDDEAEEVDAVAAVPSMVQYHGIRGKPEAMAAALAASTIDEVREELEATRHLPEDIDTMIEATAVVAEPVLDTPGSEKMEAVDAHAIPDPEYAVALIKPSSSKKKKKSSKKSTSTPKKSHKATVPLASSPTLELEVPSLDDPTEPITDAEYENLVHLMAHFCKVPLLAEFSRPVTLLHPELQAAYSKIIKHPIDLGKVCRKIRRRVYNNTREIQLDMWRIFSNCVKYHSHPSNKEAVPSFVSIALHLREYWNNLFQEFMLPSDVPNHATTAKAGDLGAKFIRETYATREEDRKKRLIVSGLTCMSPACLRRTAEKIRAFLQNQGRVDRLDEEPLFPGMLSLTLGLDNGELTDLAIVAERINSVGNHLLHLSQDNAEFTVEQFDTELKACYLSDVFENNSALKFRVRNRVNRLVGKTLVPINEANSRGVTQSCIWGCMAAAIWARESSKKPFWPALVLGILAPDDQKEDWHAALTERNEMRLPEALRTQLSAGKRKAEQALKRQGEGLADPQSFFLVEFLGTHEFIWVRETDIVESFEPEDDPNNKAQAAKKKRPNNSRGSTLVGSKKYQSAIEEAGWALEEFESQLQDACGDLGEQDEDGEDDNYSYPVLCVSDDEADDAYRDKDAMTLGEIDEANELIATRGLIDFSVNGRKNAKKRALAIKKQKQDAEKKQKLEKAKKVKAAQSKKKKKQMSASRTKERQEKKELKEIEKRRKKRAREREKALSARKKTTTKRRRPNEEAEIEKIKEGGALMGDKRARSTAIVRGYLTRMSKDKEYRSLGLSGVMSMPAAMIDSSGLLGMALAFRAAAGELSMPEESGDQEQTKPWDAIIIDDTMTENERLEALHKQAELLEDEISRVRSATKTRLHLAEEAERARQQMDEDIYREEEAARSNPFKKRKKVMGSSSKSTDDSPMGASDMGKDDNEEMKEVEMKHGAIELGVSHVTETPPREGTASAAHIMVGADKWTQ